MKEYPEWTVPACICHIAEYRNDCPYAIPEELGVLDNEKSIGSIAALLANE